MYQQHPLVAEKILNWVLRLYHWRLSTSCWKRSSIGYKTVVPAASTSYWKDPELGYKIVYQQHPAVAEKTLNWVTRLCTRRHCWYDGCSQEQWNYDYYDYYIWQECPLPFSEQLPSPAKMYVCQNTAKKPACAIHQRSLHKPTTVDSVKTMHMCV